MTFLIDHLMNHIFVTLLREINVFHFHALTRVANGFSTISFSELLPIVFVSFFYTVEKNYHVHFLSLAGIVWQFCRIVRDMNMANFLEGKSHL